MEQGLKLLMEQMASTNAMLQALIASQAEKPAPSPLMEVESGVDAIIASHSGKSTGRSILDMVGIKPAVPEIGGVTLTPVAASPTQSGEAQFMAANPSLFSKYELKQHGVSVGKARRVARNGHEILAELTKVDEALASAMAEAEIITNDGDGQPAILDNGGFPVLRWRSGKIEGTTPVDQVVRLLDAGYCPVKCNTSVVVARSRDRRGLVHNMAKVENNLVYLWTETGAIESQMTPIMTEYNRDGLARIPVPAYMELYAAKR